MPNSAPANASDEPHWPAPVSVAIFLIPAWAFVPSLRHRGVGLVRAGRRDAFVLVVDPRRRAERLSRRCADQRRRAPEAEHLAHRLGNGHVALGADLLQDQLHQEQRRQVVRADRLQRARVQHRRRSHRQIGGDVVPVLRHLALVEQELGGRAHGRPLSWWRCGVHPLGVTRRIRSEVYPSPRLPESMA